MSKKDYMKAASIVRNTVGTFAQRAILANSYVQLFKGDNPAFAPDRFTRAALCKRSDAVCKHTGNKCEVES